MTELQNLVKLAHEAAVSLRETFDTTPNYRIIGHHDADGISSAGIIARALQREGCFFHVRILRQLETSFIKELADEPHTHYIFTDLGSGQLNYLEEYFKTKQNVFVFDHHPPTQGTPPNLVHVNPHLVGIDGSTSISASGVAYLIARELNPENRVLAPNGIVGAIADRQDKGDDFQLIGGNDLIVQDGISSKTIVAEKDLRFFGRETRPIAIALQYNTDPYLPGLSGNYDNCIHLLSEAGIPLKTPENEWRTLSHLAKQEKTRLLSAIIKYYSARTIDPTIFRKLVGYTYIFPNEEVGTEMRDAHEFASLLNACGRTKHAGLGLAIVIGDRGAAYQEAQRFLIDYRTQIAQALNWLESHHELLKEKSHVICFNSGTIIGDDIISTITSIAASSNMFNPEKVLIGLAASDNNLLKISARTNTAMVEKGVDLGEALRNVVHTLDPNLEAGGHKIAAGGKISTGNVTKFFTLINSTLGQQMKNYKPAEELTQNEDQNDVTNSM